MAMTGKSLGAAVFLALAGCSAAEGQQNDSAPALPGNGMAAFASDAEVDALLKKAGSRAPQNKFGIQEALNGGEAAADAAAASAAVAPDGNAARSEDQVTNVQEKGVDEGGIVKRHGDHLVVLRRGRLFTIDTKGDRLSKLDQVDAFPPGNGDAWYDEMLISGDTVIVVGYSYGRFGTEVNRFGIDAAGRLTYRDTWHLRSADYYSSRNYASRLIGTQLVLYQPIPAGLGEDWQDSLPGLRRWRGDGPQVQENAGFKRLAKTGRIFAAAPLRAAKEPEADTFHSVVTCDLARRELDCDASVVLGGWSRSFYVSKHAVYVWTGDVDHSVADQSREGPTRSFVYRLPLDGGKPGALEVRGNPVDQFSFLEEVDKGRLNVLVLAASGGDAMWNPELGRGSAALAQLPLASFGDGSQAAPGKAYRPLALAGYGIQNRFVGRYLLYGGGRLERGGESQTLGIVPLDGGDVQGMSLQHGISRLDVMGQDAVAIGSNDRDALGFSAIGLGGDSKLLDTYFLPAAAEGENRSQAFFYKPDPADHSGASGILALPVARRLDAEWARFLGSGSAIVFLNRVNRRFAPAGELAADARGAQDDACKASCVDWYGNARPLFLGNRTFALMGYELVEGRVANGRITEQRRLNFAPDRQDKRH
jgi:Beta propeller domain